MLIQPNSSQEHIHLDLMGGIAGDMFIAAIVDCMPELEVEVANVVKQLNLKHELDIALEPWTDGILTGKRFGLTEHRTEVHAHQHASFRSIRSLLEKSDLPTPSCRRAIDIFECLAMAEGQVHGLEPEEVSFHEVGALDSILDIAIAAHLIEVLDPCDWSVSAIPIGSGRVKSQHGIIPVPAPATALLLEGMQVFDDDISGERVTPTGAAILRHLDPSQRGLAKPMQLGASGTGFGTMRLPGIPNIVRVLKYSETNCAMRDYISVISFEVDDQTPEDLATGLDIVRDHPDVQDVFVTPVFAKKNRQAQHIQILSKPGGEDDVVRTVFRQTTTLGLRLHHSERRILPRRITRVGELDVKITERQNETTAKAEADQLAAVGSTAASRTAAAHRATDAALNSSSKTR